MEAQNSTALMWKVKHQLVCTASQSSILVNSFSMSEIGNKAKMKPYFKMFIYFTFTLNTNEYYLTKVRIQCISSQYWLRQ